MTLTQRRRALMGQNGGDTSLLFQIKETQYTAGTKIGTGVAFLAIDTPGVFLLDIDVLTNSSSGAGSTYRPAVVWTNRFELGYGKGVGAEDSLHTRWQGGSWNKFDGTKARSGRKKLAIIHEANSKTATFLYKDSSTALLTRSETASTFTPTNVTLSVGGDAGAQGLPNCIIHDCRIYNRLLSQSEIDAFFA